MRELSLLSPSFPEEHHWCYNGLDTAITYEVFDAINPLLDSISRPTYNHSLSLVPSVLSMMWRGIRIDQFERRRMIDLLRKEDAFLSARLNRIGDAIYSRPINANSPQQLKDLFYQVLNIPPVYRNDKGVKKITCNRDALEKIEEYFLAEPIVALILSIRDKRKQLSVLETEIDSDGRMRTSYNIAGTETGRFNSYQSVYETGTNIQNITPLLRIIFIADRGYKLCYCDLSQAESFMTGLFAWIASGRDNYLRACEGGDLHTHVAKMVWPDLGWTGNKAADKELAETPYYRHFTYRFMCKKGGHGSNYYGKDYTIAKHMKVPTSFVTRFQKGYFSEFPEIPYWHQATATQLQLTQTIATPLGRRRQFFGRPQDDATLREAIAYGPQSSVADILNTAMARVYREVPSVQLLAQQHDAILFQYPEEKEKECLAAVKECMKVPVTATRKGGATRTLCIPCDMEVGWNWAKFDDREFNPDGSPNANYNPNPDSLIKWRGEDERKRRFNKGGSLLDEEVRAVG